MNLSGATGLADRGRARAFSLRMVWLLAFLVALILYVATAHRGVQWQDSGYQQLRMLTGQIENPLGLALVHPVQYYLGRGAILLTPFEPAFATTMISCLMAAVAVANVICTLRLLVERWFFAVLAGLALMLSHTFWMQATHTESYAVASALLTAEWLCLAGFVRHSQPGYLLLLVFFNGLGISNHLMASLVTPIDAGIVLWALYKKHLPGRLAIVAVGLWFLGLLPYLLLILVTMVKTGQVVETIHSALFGNYSSSVLNLSLSVKSLGLFVGYIVYNFPGLALPIAVYGIFKKADHAQWLWRVLKIELLFYLLFTVRYSVVDQFLFMFPVYLLLAMFFALGMKQLAWKLSVVKMRWLVVVVLITTVWTPIVYGSTYLVLSRRGMLKGLVGNKPYRDGYGTFFLPWGVGENHEEKLNEQIRRLVGEDGLVLVAEGMARFGIFYAHERGTIPVSAETEYVSPSLRSEKLPAERRQRFQDSLDRGRAVVLVPHDRDQPKLFAQGVNWQRKGDLYVLAGLAEAKSAPASNSSAGL